LCPGQLFAGNYSPAGLRCCSDSGYYCLAQVEVAPTPVFSEAFAWKSEAQAEDTPYAIRSSACASGFEVGIGQHQHGRAATASVLETVADQREEAM